MQIDYIFHSNLQFIFPLKSCKIIICFQSVIWQLWFFEQNFSKWMYGTLGNFRQIFCANNKNDSSIFKNYDIYWFGRILTVMEIAKAILIIRTKWIVFQAIFSSKIISPNKNFVRTIRVIPAWVKLPSMCKNQDIYWFGRRLTRR